jgi:GNAT superfamily N-acetyltransferase
MVTPPEVRLVTDRRGLLDFVRVPFSVYRNDPNWIAPLMIERLEHLDVRRNPYFAHAEAGLFVAYQGRTPIGRITAQVDRLRLERYADATGQFGFFDVENDPAIARALTETAESWLKDRGMRRALGPFSFSINDETGLLVDGFDRPPCFMMGHARPYMSDLLSNRGYTPAKDLIAYDYDARMPLPRAMQSMIDKAVRSGDLVVRPFRKKNLASELDIIMRIFNDAWSENWEFVPFTAEELRALGKNLKMLVSDEYIAIAEYQGEPAAMAVTLPDINGWLAGLRGSLLPFGWASLMYNLFARHPSAVRMPLMGVIRRHHGTAIGSALAISVIDRLRRYHLDRGTKRAELSWILEDNTAMRRIIEQVGAVPYKTYRVFQKALA